MSLNPELAINSFYKGQVNIAADSGVADCLANFLEKAIRSVVEVRVAAPHTRVHIADIDDRDREQSNHVGQTKDSEMSKILIVVDDVESSQAYAEILASAGHSVKMLHSHAEIFRVLSLFVPNIVLVDMNVPGMSNMLTLSIIRRMSELTRTKIIVSTQYSDMTKTAQLNWRVDAVLTKPVSSEQLLETVSKLKPPPNGH